MNLPNPVESGTPAAGRQAGWAGAVLAGGQSRRMGRDKAMLLLDGEPLWARQVRFLAARGAAPVGVVRRPEQPALGLPADVPLWLDAVADAGPLAGLHAALAANAAPLLAVLAVDMPRVAPDWFARLGARCLPGAGAVGRHPDGTFEPLAAIYGAAAGAIAAEHLRARQLSLQELVRRLVALRHLAVLDLAPADARALASWNEPADAGAAG